MTGIDDIRDNFELLDDWDDRYRYVIELGRTLEPMPESEHSAENKVQGCVSQVWLQKLVDRDGGTPRPEVPRRQRRPYRARRWSRSCSRSIRATRRRTFSRPTRLSVFEEFGFREHLSPQRSNGLRAMVERIKTDAKEALAEAS